MERGQIYLLDILRAAEWALKHVEGMELEQFLADVKTQDSVIRRLEMIGEAARRVSESTRTRISTVPWQRLVSMRNFLIHDYDNVDLSIVWDTVQTDLPSLISALEAHVPPESKAE